MFFFKEKHTTHHHLLLADFMFPFMFAFNNFTDIFSSTGFIESLYYRVTESSSSLFLFGIINWIAELLFHFPSSSRVVFRPAAEFTGFEILFCVVLSLSPVVNSQNREFMLYSWVHSRVCLVSVYRIVSLPSFVFLPSLVVILMSSSAELGVRSVLCCRVVYFSSLLRFLLLGFAFFSWVAS